MNWKYRCNKKSISEKSKDELIEIILDLAERLDLLEEANAENTMNYAEIREKQSKLEKEKIDLEEKLINIRNKHEKTVEELNRIKKLPQRPKLKPSAAHQKKESKAGRNNNKKCKDYRKFREEKCTIPRNELPSGSSIHSWENFSFQDIRVEIIQKRYKRAIYKLPDGTLRKAPLPQECGDRHYGLGLAVFIANQHHKNNVPQEKIVKDLQDMGVQISAGTVQELLREAAQLTENEAVEIFEMGKNNAQSLSVDDTGGRHRGKNGSCIVVCNNAFTAYSTGESKSRMAFYRFLRGKQDDYVLNEYAYKHMIRDEIHHKYICALEPYWDTVFENETSWNAFTKRVLEPIFTGKTNLRKIAEAAIWGSAFHNGLQSNVCINSDGAPQYDVARHCLCWIHVGRILEKQVPENEALAKELKKLRDDFWDYYRKLAVYCVQDVRSQGRNNEFRDNFDSTFSQTFKSEIVMAMQRNIAIKKEKLLISLDYPAVPLHNNGTEREVRPMVIKRKISGGTRTDQGRRIRDSQLTIIKTCQKHGVSYWQYLNGRLLRNCYVPYVPDLVRQRLVAQQSP